MGFLTKRDALEGHGTVARQGRANRDRHQQQGEEQLGGARGERVIHHRRRPLASFKIRRCCIRVPTTLTDSRCRVPVFGTQSDARSTTARLGGGQIPQAGCRCFVPAS